MPGRSRRLRIGIDAHAIGERKTGNERWVANLIPALRAICEHDLILYFTSGEGASRYSGLEGTQTRVMRPGHPLVRIPFVLPHLAARDRLDVLLVQYAGPPVFRRPLVTMVHDISFARLPECFTPRERIWLSRTVPFTMRRAAGILTVSEFSRREIVEVFGVAPERITVAHNGVDPVFLDSAPRASPFPPPYFVAVGNLQPRKGLGTLLSAYARALELRPGLRERLVIVGQDAFAAAEIHAQARELRERGRVSFTGYIGDAELVGLLQGATAFAYPSLYEGFGLPPVEAMAAGVPSLVSDIPVTREILGESALRLPPSDVEAWAAALLRIATDDALRARLRAEGRARASGYTWQRSAIAVLSALEAAVPETGDVVRGRPA